MGSFKTINGRTQATPEPQRLGGILAAINSDEAVIKSQLDTLQAEVDAIEAGTIQLDVIEAGNGTVSAPSYTFASDLDTGMYRIGANNIGVGVAGAKVLDISATGLGVVGTVLNGDGAVGTPAYSFTSDADTGMYHVGANQLGFAANGVLQFMATTSGLNVDTINERTTGVGISAANIINYKLTTSITAHTGGGQGSATALASQYNEITTCSSAGDSVVLPTAIVGMRITVRNLGANYADVFPATGGTIDAGSANAAVRLQPGQTATYTALSTTAWVSDNKASVPVAQGTNITTGVICSAVKGLITTQTASAGAAGATPNTFTVTNTFVQADSHISVYIMDYSGTIATNGNPVVQVDNRTDGTFDIIISNCHGTNALNGTLVIGFEVKN